MNKREAPVRHYCFTFNNYTDETLHLIRVDRPKFVRYVVIGFEVGEKKETPHLQGYAEFDKTVRLATLRKWLPGAHWEARLGTRDQARDYCMKGIQSHEDWKISGRNHPDFGKEAVVEEFGSWTNGGPGARTDINTFVEALYAGESLESVACTMPNTYCRNTRAMKDYAMWAERKRAREMGFRHVKVHVVWGAAGVGKSRSVNAVPGDKCMATLGSRDFPLQNYDGESAIWIDDFYGQIPWAEFFRMTDGQPYVINVKGGCRHALYTDVYITSNVDPLKWYPNIEEPYMKAAFLRRLTSVTHIGIDGSLDDCMKAVSGHVDKLVTETNSPVFVESDQMDLFTIVSDTLVSGNEVLGNSGDVPLPAPLEVPTPLTTISDDDLTELYRLLDDDINDDITYTQKCDQLQDNIAEFESVNLSENLSFEAEMIEAYEALAMVDECARHTVRLPGQAGLRPLDRLVRPRVGEPFNKAVNRSSMVANPASWLSTISGSRTPSVQPRCHIG